MTAQEVTTALGTRRTVRIQYSRGCDTYYVSLAQGDRVTGVVAYISQGEFAEDVAEKVATLVADRYGLDITRLDVN